MSYFNAIRQEVVVDSNNSYDLDLNSGNSYTFTGAYSSTLGVAAIQVTLKTNQNCIVQIQQSPDHSNWDIIDTYDYIASINNFGITVKAVNSYVRVVVTTASLTTTGFRLQTCLCPITESLPRSLDAEGNLKVAIKSIEDSYGFEVENTPFGEMRVVEPVRLVGATFDGSTIDSNFWTTAATGTGASISQANAQLTIVTGTASGATVTAYSFRRGRYVGGTGMRYRAAVQLDAGTTNNVRRWGIGFGATMPTVTDGAYFQLSDTEFSINTIKGGSIAKVTSFNGTLGVTHTPGTTVATYEIYWTNSKVYFVINGRVLHTVSASTTTWCTTMSHYIFMDSNNTAAATSVNMYVRVATICRLGKLETAPIWKNINTTAVTGLILKRGPGRLHKIIFNNSPNSTSVSLYDSLTATNPIAIISPVNGTSPFELDYDLDFYTGLTITTTPASANITIVYE